MVILVVPSVLKAAPTTLLVEFALARIVVPAVRNRMADINPLALYGFWKLLLD